MNDKQQEIQRYIEKAEQALEISRQLLTSGYPADAISKAYYAMFYAAHAALRAKDVVASRHAAVIAEFGRIYAKAGLIDPELHRALIDAFDERQEADYNVFLEVEELQGRRRIADAQAFLQAVRSYLQQQHHLEDSASKDPKDRL